MNFDLVEVLTRAWKITWKHKVLWIFGILASCGQRSSGGNSSSNQGGYSGGQTPPDNPFSDQMIQQAADFFEGMEAWFSENTWVIAAFVLFFLLFIILQVFLSITGGIGLVRGAYQAETGIEQIRFGSLFGESLRYFWRVFGLGLTLFLPIILVFIAFFILLILGASSASSSIDSFIAGSSILFLIGLCCCLFPIIFLLGLYYTQALRALVLEDLGVFASLARAWSIFIKNIGGLLFTAVIIFIIRLIIGAIIAIPVYIVIFPILFKLISEGFTSWQPLILAGIFLLCYSPIAWFITGILMTYTETIWTLIYLRVTTRREDAPISLPANA
jgi:hypothetical protein